MNETVFITAGTNVGNVPMAQPDAIALSNAIRAAIADSHGTIFLAGIGEGSWEGVTENSYVFGATVPDSGHLWDLGEALRLIARRFGQQAIGLTVHCSDYGDGGESLIFA